MSAAAVRVEDLGKQYRIRLRRRLQDKTLRDQVAGALAAPFRRLGSGDRQSPALGGRPALIWALRHVTFEIRHGEVLGVIGRNGAGKSTVLKILSRITEPTEGRAIIDGRVGSLLEVGTGFHGDLSGRDNIFLNGALLGMTRREIQTKFDAIVAFAEVETFLDTPVRHYSSGMYMRLAFAVAAHLDPEILLVDEVLAVGDAAFQKKCLAKMHDVATEGRTVLFVSHNMHAIEQMCTSAVCFVPGQPPTLQRDTRLVIGEYLFGADRQGLSATIWTNAGGDFKNRWFTPMAFRLTDRQGRPLAQPATNNDDMWVNIEGEIESVDPGLMVGYTLHTETGVFVYCSYHTDGPDTQWPAITRGRVVLRGRVPSHLLNEGTYRLELSALLYQRQAVIEPAAPAAGISLTIRGGLSDSTRWVQPRAGVVAPVAEWIQGS
jgi:lipopolysaccharide transport system ATP-binding protein